MKCWELRGCYEDAEMNGRCPHNIPGEPCPADCHFAACFRPTHVVCTDFGKLLNPSRDFDAAIKEICRFCEFFLEHGRSCRRRPHPSGQPEQVLALGAVSVEAVNMHAACPSCGCGTFDMARYRAIMVLGPETALFTLDCPKCGAQVQLLRAIPGALREEVRASAQQVGAGGLN